jgi:hypothetical protein
MTAIVANEIVKARFFEPPLRPLLAHTRLIDDVPKDRL